MTQKYLNDEEMNDNDKETFNMMIGEVKITTRKTMTKNKEKVEQ